MPKILPVLRRKTPLKEHGGIDLSFLSAEFAPIKQEVRDITARLFAAHVPPDATILCMPYYLALCAKAIYALLPMAEYHGIERDKDVAENVVEVAPGKKIIMHKMTVHRFITTDRDPTRFDAAFIDYFGSYSEERSAEIVQFVERKMHRSGILAATMQGDQPEMIQVLYDLRLTRPTAKMIFCKPYRTNSAMCHAIFVFEDAENKYTSIA